MANDERDYGSTSESDTPIFGDDTDADSNYSPDENYASSTSSSDDHKDLEGPVQDLPENAIPPPKQLGKKRVRRTDLWKCEKTKRLRNSGKGYRDRKMKDHPPKELREYNHNCRFNCNINIPQVQRQVIFNSFWNLADWELQTSYINGALELMPIKRRRPNAANRKDVSVAYNLAGYRVCREFFLKTLDVSNKRVRNVTLKKQQTPSGVAMRDKRGNKEPKNKIPEETIAIVEEHIRSFPKYTSHYSRVKTPNKKFLDPTLNLTMMYNLYKEMCQDKGIMPVKDSFYRKIFNTRFNLSFHRPQTDTCVTCDRLDIKIIHGTEEEKKLAKTQKEVHLRNADSIKELKNKSSQNKSKDTVSICFDLQKMMPTPNVRNSKAYYMRQLWTYNLNIHNLQDRRANMYMWHEGQAKRGCQEITSCLLKYIQTLPNCVKHIEAFSDNCGGQNKSHLTTKFWLYIIRNTNIESVTQHFFVPGHSYNECDQDFGLIEIKKKHVQRDFYVPEDWIQLVASTNKKFIVTQMRDEDFIHIEHLNNIFPKKVKGIRKMQILHFKKGTPSILHYKNCAGDLEGYSKLNMRNENAGKVPMKLQALIPTSCKPKLKEDKIKDLMSLLQFVPPVYHDFYIGLKNVPVRPAVYEKAAEADADEDDEEQDNIYDTDADE